MSIKTELNSGWKFFRGDLAPADPADEWGGAKARAYSFGAAAADCHDSAWRTVDLPHDFVSEGDYSRRQTGTAGMQRIPEMESIDSRLAAGGSLEGGVAWYRKRFSLPYDDDRRVYLHFGGVYRNSDVYLNEYFIGHHTSGYTSFYYDITDFVNFGGDNILAVRVDSRGREGWWYEGGGIYRSVWLEVTHRQHIAPWGVFAAPSADIEKKTASVKITTELANKAFEDKTLTVRSVIEDAEGNAVTELSTDVFAAAWDGAVCNQAAELSSVRLWDIDDPYLYMLKTYIYDGAELTDVRETRFGIRECRFDADKGFFLNGRHLKIKGLCLHHDAAGVGIGMTESLFEYRIDRIKSMGANAYRCAHHPPAQELLDVCDRTGMLVFEETRRMSSCNDDIEALRSMVKRDRNHPSVFLWGIGNEEIFSQHRPETARTTLTMKAEVHKLDPTRPVTSAVVCWNGKERFDTAEGYTDVTKNLDIMGFNYCPTAWDDYHRRMPEQPIIITEASSNSGTRGCYSTDEDRSRYYVLDPDNALKCKSGKKALKKDEAETQWKMCADRDYLAGIFLWTGFDYRGEPTPLSYPAVYSQFGIFDYCGFEKDNYYYYKSRWTDEPTLHVFPNWNYPVKPDEPVSVYCYSNLDEAEIFVNGKSLGKKKTESGLYLEWDGVIYEPGEIKAVGYKDGKAVMTDTSRTSKSAYAVRLEAYKTVTEPGDTVIVKASIVDEDGVLSGIADNEIAFDVSGAGSFIGTGNGNPGDHASEKVPVRRAFNGLCLLLARADAPGRIKITASADGIRTGACEIEVKRRGV